MKLDRLLWRHLIRPLQRMHRRMYARGKTGLLGKIVLLLSTTGRKTGLKRVTPLQFSELDGDFYVAAARGQRADWFLNLKAEPRVEVQVDQRHFQAVAEPVTDAPLIARHPHMGPAMMRMHHLPGHPSRAQLEQLSTSLALVILHPVGFSDN
jgi:deazaflavin-dependent oxidoreductase (nitroreductase family)